VNDVTVPPDVSAADTAERRAIDEIRSDLRRDNVQRALNRLSDLIESKGNACDKQIRHTSILLMQEYHRAAYWKINNAYDPESISRIVGNISIRALELCDYLLGGQSPVKLSPPVDPHGRPVSERSLALSQNGYQPYLTKSEYLEKDAVVDAQGISRIFRSSGFQLEPLDIRVNPGQILAIVGMNGSGKSTLLDILRGEVAPDTGRVRFPLLSQPEGDWRNVRAQIGYVAQRSSPWRGSISENLEYAAAAHGIVGEENIEWTNRLIARHGLTNYKDRAWPELSAGFRMRFDLALARVNRPRLLILDEPLGNLDLVSQQSFLFDLVQLAKGGSHTAIIITSQHLFEIEALADEVILLAGGKRVVRTPAKQVYFELGWPTTATITEEAVSAALQPFEPVSVKVDTTSCLVGLKSQPRLAEVIATASERGLSLTYIRDVTNSALVEMHKVAALDDHR
jgi:ABC-2 type transport system ATP-binding protein